MHENFAKVVNPDSEEAELLSQIDESRLPRHIAIIMDGNGRWAKLHGKPRVFGHRAGVESVRSIVDTSARLGLKAVTLYAFSTENWKRPQDEVGALMTMLKHFLGKEIKTLQKNNIRFQPIGKIKDLAEDVRQELANAVEKTKQNTGTILSIALNYGGRAEILEAVKQITENLIKTGASPADLTEDDIEKNLYTHGLPEVDLLIRTSGEMRISNFLLWQLAYSEIFITPTLFPDFRLKNFLEAVLDFQKRERRFGGVENK